MTRPATGKGSRRRERYEAQDIDLTAPPKKAEPKNQTKAKQSSPDRGYSESDGPEEKAERARTAYEAVIAGIHGRDLSKKEVAEEETRRHYEGVNNGTPLTHEGFSEADQKKLKDAAKADTKRVED
jgi:hypothetical protein